MGEDPDSDPQRDRADPRRSMGETVDALGYKADVKTRTKEPVVGKVTSVKEKVIGSCRAPANDATPDAEQVKAQGARRAKGLAQENPLGLAIGAIAVGFLAGMLIPSTRVEDEKLGEIADQVKDKAKETGQEALEHGKQVAQETAQSAQETLKESAQQHGQEAGEAAKQHAQEVRS